MRSRTQVAKFPAMVGPESIAVKKQTAFVIFIDVLVKRATLNGI
jgi:hypothetical protein